MEQAGKFSADFCGIARIRPALFLAKIPRLDCILAGRDKNQHYYRGEHRRSANHTSYDSMDRFLYRKEVSSQRKLIVFETAYM